MSRGFGRWEREIMHATAGVCVAPVGGIVRAVVPEPCRDDHASARRAAKQLAIKNEVSALYCWTCPRCFRVQDRVSPEPCCSSVRSMLAVCDPQRRRQVLHPAPAPGPVPPWIGLNDAPAAPPGLAVPTVGDLASLAAARLYARLEAGTIAVGPADVAVLTRLAREAEREHHAGHPDEHWQQSLREILWTARSHLRDGWPAFASDLRSNTTLKGLWGDPLRPGP